MNQGELSLILEYRVSSQNEWSDKPIKGDQNHFLLWVSQSDKLPVSVARA